ncbi:MAG: hypothetical protein KA419_05340 [Acidobacteria bacterium]|nr:hypothetical protein [Acidobacteriota bacterium]
MNRRPPRCFRCLVFLFAATFAVAGAAAQGFNLTGTYRDGPNEWRVLDRGDGAYAVQFLGRYKYLGFDGRERFNEGEIHGVVTLAGNKAVLTSPEEYARNCRITLEAAGGFLNVRQEGECGFGNNVRADGRYRRVSGETPVFEGWDGGNAGGVNRALQKTEVVPDGVNRFRIRFPDGGSTEPIFGTVKFKQVIVYVFRARAGQTLDIRLRGERPDDRTEFCVVGPARSLPMGSGVYADHWNGRLGLDGEHRIEVSTVAESSRYVLRVNLGPSGGAVPPAGVEPPPPPGPPRVPVTGTWTFRERGARNEIRVEEIGRRRIRVMFVGNREYRDASGERMADSSGTGALEVPLERGRAEIRLEEYPDCRITLAFDGDTLTVEQENDCGFARRVTATGSYRRVSSEVPDFGREIVEPEDDAGEEPEPVAEPLAVRAGGKPVRVRGSIAGGRKAAYALDLKRGQTLSVSVTSDTPNHDVVFYLVGPDGSEPLDMEGGYSTTWTGRVKVSGPWKILVDTIETENADFVLRVKVQ